MLINKITIFTTTRCQLDCSHCLNKQSNRKIDFPVRLLPRLIGELIPFGIRHISFTGGEPILHPRFSEIIDIVNKYMLKWSFVSNGYNYDKYLKLINLERDNFSLVGISIDGAESRTHSLLRRKSKSFQIAINAIERYVGVDLKVWMKVCIHQKNLHELEAIVKLGEDLGVEGIRFAGIIPTERNRELQLLDGDSRNLVEKITGINKSSKLILDYSSSLITGGGINICQNMYLDTLSFNAKGEMIFCCDTPQEAAVIGSVHSKSMSKLIQKWLETLNQIQKTRVMQIANGTMPEGFDNCSYCQNHFINK